MRKDYYKTLLSEFKNGSVKRFTSLEGNNLGKEVLFENTFSGRVLEENLTPLEKKSY